MRIAFDLDDTLIPSTHSFPTEPRPQGLRAWFFGMERLRAGTGPLFQQLQRAGHEVWIYTTSLRIGLAARQLFLCHGARISGCVNQIIHNRRIAELWPMSPACSKYPPAFGIDLLVDDSVGVVLESRRLAFRVLHVCPDDPD